MDLDAIRRLAIQAAFADDALMDQLVLKGGNALSLVYGIGSRSSVDVDFSMAEDFDEARLRELLHSALTRRFDSAGFEVFDYGLERRPSGPAAPHPRWGGYRAQFKLIERSLAARLGSDIEAWRRQSQVTGPGQKRIFTIDISRFEYCESKREEELDGFFIHVYTPVAIAIEKLRAICQQMPEYTLNQSTKGPRARDFYDIHCVVEQCKLDLGSAQCLDLARHVFAAKEVPLTLLPKIGDRREYHRPDWERVVSTVSERLEPFDFYVDWLVGEAGKLHPLWEE